MYRWVLKSVRVFALRPLNSVYFKFPTEGTRAMTFLQCVNRFDFAVYTFGSARE